MHDSFGARSTLRVGDRRYTFYRLAALEAEGIDLGRLPYSLRILLENLLRHEDGFAVTAEDILALARWDPRQPPEREIAFMPARVLLQDFTGVPAIVDLAAMRDAMAELGGDPKTINPLQPVELVIDHSIQVDAFGTPEAFRLNQELDYQRNGERYAFLKWGQRAFANFQVVPPNMGIVHQVNLEYLARVVFDAPGGPDGRVAFPDTLVGTDSHTPMVNGLGVLGWGVGGIEAEAAMLGQPIAMLIPEVIGFRLVGELPEGATATDLVLTVTEILRKKGVVGKFVEFFGPGVAQLRLADRATIGNMAPEYGATVAIFPVDQATLDYLRFTGRSEEQVALVEAYMKEQGLFHTPDAREPVFTDVIELDLNTVEPSIAGPRRPQDRVPLSQAKRAFVEALPSLLPPQPAPEQQPPEVLQQPAGDEVRHGSVVIAAITSCTNTSNPAVMVAAGLVAKKAAERGLRPKPWVKTSLAPGSRVVTEYYQRAGLLPYLEQLGFAVVGYGCTTCIGNSGPLLPEVSDAIARKGLVVCSVLSGNRNFEGRIQPEVRANFLMSPPLVVAYALVGRIDWDPYNEPIGVDRDGRSVFLRDLWPTREEIEAVIQSAIESEMYRRNYARVFDGDERWQALPAPSGERFAWDPGSTYIRRPPYFDGMPRQAPTRIPEVRGARVLALLGDSVTTDHISPAGSIKKDSPAGQYLIAHGVAPKDFNSYGARRGNHEVMVRGTFANVRLRNRLVPQIEGGYTLYLPDGEVMTIYEAAMRYRDAGVPLLVIAGKEYGSGSSRDWAAKGPYLLGVRAVIAESFERIHRSNLVGMGIVPLQFREGENAETLGLTGREVYDLEGLPELVAADFAPGRELKVVATADDGRRTEFWVRVRLDTPQEVLYVRHGGILPYVLRQLLDGRRPQGRNGLHAAPLTAPGERVAPTLVEESLEETFPASDPPAY